MSPYTVKLAGKQSKLFRLQAEWQIRRATGSGPRTNLD